MTYTNITGKFIGECMTGFGINYPVKILNSGNSDVLYHITSSDSNFEISNSDLIVSNGGSGSFDILFYPTFSVTSGYETTLVTISSESVDDGSVDPSGDINLYITGHRLVDTTGGHIRNFRALRNYDADNGLNYTFYWKPPTGTGYLNNYFITGYQIEISTTNDFSSIVVSKQRSVEQNNFAPRYSSYYGFPDEDIFTNISKYDNGTQFELNTSYYARIYTWVDGVTGESVYATGIDDINTIVSNEVLTGNVSVKNDIRFTKRAIDVYVPPKIKYVNYNLYNDLVEKNKGSNNFLYISGINVYLPTQTTFSSTSDTNYCLNLDGLLKRFTGDATYGTNINIYLEETTNLLSYKGKGGDLKNITPNTNIKSYIDNIQSIYNSNSDPTCTDAKNGGPIFNFNIKSTNTSDQEITDLNYNVYQKFGSKIQAGGGGSKASITWLYGNGSSIISFVGNDKNNVYYKTIFYLNGKENDKKITDINIYKTQLVKNSLKIEKDEVIAAISKGGLYGNLSTWPCVNGEDDDRVADGFGSSYLRILDNSQANTLIGSINSPNVNTIDLGLIDQTLYSRPINTTSSLAGKIVNGSTNSKPRLFITKYEIPSDFVFRFANSGITNSPGIQWSDTTNTALLQGSTTASIYNNSIYSHVGKNSITLHNQEYLQYTFNSTSNSSMTSKNCNEFDFYMVVAYRPVNKVAKSEITPLGYVTSKFKLLDWCLDLKNTIDKQVIIKYFPYYQEVRQYRKESNIFEFFIAPLMNGEIKNSISASGVERLWDVNTVFFNNKYIQVSKSLLNATDYYPMIINVKRSNTFYSIYINGSLVITYDMGSFITNASSYVLQNIDNSILKLLTNCTLTNGSNKETVTYFDLVFYNKILNSDETVQLYSYYMSEYLKLFTGGTTDYIDLKSNRIRLPNIFNVAGRNLV